MVSGFPYYTNINNKSRAMYTWADFYHLFGIKTKEDLSASDPNQGRTSKDFNQITEEEAEKQGKSGEATPLEGINPLGVGIDRRQANARNTDCSKECGSFFNPGEWGCYVEKGFGGCGGSTGLCDAFGAGEACTKYAKYAVVVVVIIAGALIAQRFIR